MKIINNEIGHQFSCAKNNFVPHYVLAGRKYYVFIGDHAIAITRSNLMKTLKSIHSSQSRIEGFQLKQFPNYVYLTSIK